MTPQQQEIKNMNLIKIFVTYFMLISSCFGEEDAKINEIRMRLLDVNEADPMGLVSEAWQLQRMDLISECINSSNSRISNAIKIKYGNAETNDFRDRVAVILLRATDELWGIGTSPPSSFSNTIDFAMKRNVLDTITRKMGNNYSSLNMLNSRSHRLEMAKKLEIVVTKTQERGVINSDNTKSSSLEKWRVDHDSKAECDSNAMQSNVNLPILYLLLFVLSTIVFASVAWWRFKTYKIGIKSKVEQTIVDVSDKPPI